MYELRTNDNPEAMPTGTATISRHRTLDAARNARDTELRRFRRSPYGQAGTWLDRVIVDPSGQVASDPPNEREMKR